jgi:Holliday junction resolvase
MAKKTDTNQAEIIRALREVGASVEDTHEHGRGFPDIVVGFRGENYLMEIKSGKGKLNQREVEWHENWKGSVWVVHTPEQAIRILGFGVAVETQVESTSRGNDHANYGE